MAGRPDSLLRILRDAVAESPPTDRRMFAGILATWTVVVGLQIWDVTGRSSPYVAAELFGVVVLITGVLLLALTWTLQSQADRAAMVGPGERASPTPKAIVLALPVLASLGATCFGFAAAMYILRAFMGAPIGFVIAICACVGFVLVIALQLVARTTRSLYHWAQEQAAHAARAEADAERATLAALQAQMNPHFLFNALNTVAALVPADAARAERTVENLSAVLRQTLARSAHVLTSVEDEVRFVRHYLEVEQERFGARLVVDWDVSDAAMACVIPTMSLQPLVENAIKHVVQTRLRGGRIGISAAVVNGTVQVAVSDDGDGFSGASRDGTGLGNLRQRLRSLYGPASELLIDSSPQGARVTLVLPASGPAGHERRP